MIKIAIIDLSYQVVIRDTNHQAEALGMDCLKIGGFVTHELAGDHFLKNRAGAGIVSAKCLFKPGFEAVFAHHEINAASSN